MSVWQIVVVAVAIVLVAVLILRLHAFLALLLAGSAVAILTPPSALQDYAEGMPPAAAEEFLGDGPVDRLADAFGDTAGSIGILIALASIVGGCLLESGAASVIVRRALQVMGAARAPLALAGSSFILSIPVFFDTVFYLLVPLAKQLRLATGKNYVFYVLAILAGGSIAHSLVPPTPGPLKVASDLDVDILTMITGGCIVGLLSNCFSLPFAWWINRRTDVPLRIDEHEREIIDLAGEATGPPLALCLAPIILPVVLIASETGFGLYRESAQPTSLTDAIGPVISVLGNKNIALGFAAAISFILLRYAPASINRRDVVGRALAGGGVIILITSAGGAFGAMLRQAGIAAALADLTSEVPGLMLLPIAFGLTAAIRTLQGSSTVAMITAAGVLQPLAFGDALPFHTVYLALAIGAGSKPISWMTDSGFWIICKMSGMTDAEGLRTVAPMSCAMGLAALFWVMVGASLFPLR